MHTYLVKVHVEKIGVVEVSVNAYTPVDAQRLVRAQYAPAAVILVNCRQVS